MLCFIAVVFFLCIMFFVVSFISLVALPVLLSLFQASSKKAVPHVSASIIGLQLFYNKFEAYASDGP